MPPNRNNTPTPTSSSPQPSFAPPAPQTGYNATPQFQQNPNGAYEVVPPLPVANNVGRSGHNPYEFIVNPNTPKHTPLGLSNLVSSWKALVVLGVGIIVALIVVSVVMSSLAPKGSTPGLTAAAERQQEIIRIATTATQNATSSDVRNFAITVELTMQSSQSQTVAYLADHGTKLSTKQLALDQSTQTDTLLADAATAGNYDSTVTQNLTGQLQTYEGILNKTFTQTSSTSTKALLQSNYATAQKLLAQAKTLSTVPQ